MTIKLFDEPGEAVEPTQQTETSIGARFLFCALASLVAVVPALAASSSAQILRTLIGGMTDAESVKAARVMAELHMLNAPVVVALGVAALLAFVIALVLGVEPRRRIASVGLPFSIGVPIIATVPGLLLWQAESIALDVLAGKYHSNLSIAQAARAVVILLVSARLLGPLAVGVALLCSLVSLCLSPQSRTDAFSFRRVLVWAITGTLMLGFAIGFFLLV